jgi:predicted Zn-dependent protease
MGLAVDPTNARLLTQYALDLDSAGRLPERDAVLEELLLAKPDRDASAYARAVLALRAGDLDTFDAVIFAWTGDDSSQTERTWLRVQAWLDLDDPHSALQELSTLKRARRGNYVRQLRVEGTRRLGDPELAFTLLEGKKGQIPESLDYDMLRAMVLVDLGRLDEAGAILREYMLANESTVHAAAWYLARARGDSGAMTSASVRYEAVAESPLRRLEHLVPITQRL